VRVAFATCSWFPHGVEEEHEAARELGADFRSWDDPEVDWARYDRVVIRSTWDYTLRLEEFLGWVRSVGPRLRNRPELVAFNADKRYLAALCCPTVPTTFVAPGDPLPELGGEVVGKPNVSGGARDTGRFSAATRGLAHELIERIRRSGRVALVQPYLEAVDQRGETALVFLGGELSHVLRKQPVLAPDEVAPVLAGGGPAEAMLRENLVAAADCLPAEAERGRAVIEEVAGRFGMPLYARVDLVPAADGEPLLLELEVIEPRLYLHLAPGSAARLAAAVLAS
jgi:glutathione synthase/RimK-type ligase-like ATP-grasp enzyme